ncbi:MAG: amidohydrolase family protein [Longimicrobiales bacterium]
MNVRHRRRILCLLAAPLLMLALPLLGCDGRTLVPDGAVVIRNGTVIDGTGSPPTPGGVVVVQGERIVAVGPEGEFRFHPDQTFVDAAGGTILPGFINSHIHHGAPANTRHLFLLEGITSVCDLGSELSEMGEFKERSGSDGRAARGFRGGPILTAPAGYPDAAYGTQINYEVNSASEGRAGVQDLAERGADLIKIALDPGWDRENPRPVPDLATVQAVVEEAHGRGLLVRAHLIQPPQMDLAIEARVDVIEHLAMPRWPSREEENRVMASNDPVGLFFDRWAPDYQARLEKMAAQGTAMFPTVSALLHDFYVAEEPTPRQAWVVDVVLDIVRRFHEAGGMVGVANDFNDRGSKERLPLLELEMLLEAGMSPLDVIVAATRNNAWVCGQERKLGTLEIGKLADVIVVGGDPLADLVGSIQNVTHVLLGGELVIPPEAGQNGSD